MPWRDLNDTKPLVPMLQHRPDVAEVTGTIAAFNVVAAEKHMLITILSLVIK